jgi:hypothetical protein
MSDLVEAQSPAMSISASRGHSRWVRICQWAAAASFMALALSGFFILMVHPRLYLGHVGNDLTPALLTLPISNNYRPDELQSRMAFAELPAAPISAERNYSIFNQNGWARSLHFLAAWIVVGTGAVYFALGVFSGHMRRDLLPRGRELAPRSLLRDLRNHFPPRVGPAGIGPPYGLLQKLAYASVMFVVLPLMVTTGLTMSPGQLMHS